MNELEREYWVKYYDDDDVVGSDNFHKNVGRTKAGIPISDILWEKTIGYIEDLISVDSVCDVVELCCGNGQVIGNIAPRCREAVGVDYSTKLLEQMESRFGKLVKPIHANVLDIDFDAESVDIVIVYASIQHFDERETIQLVDRSLRWLRKGGRLFLGDIPDELRKWSYVNKPSYKHDYIKRALNGNPMIGSWYQPKFFKALSDYFDGISVKVIKQPDYQNNSAHRFDVLIKKL